MKFGVPFVLALLSIVSATTGYITVYNGGSPGLFRSFEVARSPFRSGGIIQFNRHVGSQTNVGLRKKRSKFRKIYYGHLPVDTSKRNIKEEEGNEKEHGMSKRYLQQIGTIYKQTNIDMGARRKRNTY